MLLLGMRLWRMVAGVMGLMGIVGATLYAHARPVPALGQAAYIALFHAPVLLWISDKKHSDALSVITSILFSLGVLIFTGSIYLKYLGGIERATAIAPIGGIFVIFGWIGIILRALWPWE